MGTQKNRLNEKVLLSTQNKCLKLGVRKYLQFYAEKFCLSKPMYLQTTHSYFEGGYQDTNVYILDDLKSGHTIDGPSIIMNGNRYGRKISFKCTLCTCNKI